MEELDDVSRVSGWLIRDRGVHYVMTDRGWIELLGVDREDLERQGVGTEQPVAVHGRWKSATSLEPHRVTAIGTPARRGADPARRPYFVVHPVPQLHAASRLRGRLHERLHRLGFMEISLPSIWARSEEYGVEEFTLTHSLLGPDTELRLLQSPEFALWTAMAAGLDDSYSFARCYRHEARPAQGREGDYLAEFEQLVIARSGTTLEEMVELAENLVATMAAEAGIAVRPEDFVRVDPLEGDGRTTPDGRAVDELVLFTVPAHWPVAARRVTRDRLEQLGAQVYLLAGADDDEADAREATDPADAVLGSPGRSVRWAVVAGPQDAAVRRVLDIAGGFDADGASLLSAATLQWNPVWNLHPPVAWGQDEDHDSTYQARSITSLRLADETGEQFIADAELYLAGREIVHVRAYADGQQFKAAVEAEQIPGLEQRYRYLPPLLENAPTGLVGVFIGWERLMSLLTGVEAAADMQLFPRSGSGRTLRRIGPA